MRRVRCALVWAATCGASFTASCIPAKDPLPLAGCSATSGAAQPGGGAASESDATPVVLVVLDGVRWQEVFAGIDPVLAGMPPGARGEGARDLLPNLYAALETRGAVIGAPGHGKAIAASGPNFVSMPGYTEIFEGRAPDGCQDNACDGAQASTIVDEVRHRVAADSQVAVFASWERIQSAATRDPAHIVLSAGRAGVHGAAFLASDPELHDVLDRGALADPYPGSDGFRPDRYTAALALRYLGTMRPAFLFVGLGEPDEYAHRGDYVGYLGALRAADRFVGELFTTLDRLGERGRRTLVLLTADHGRARDYREHGGQYPESARVWLAAFGGPVRARGFAPAPEPRRLADVAPTIRAVLDLDTKGDGPAGGTPLSELFDEADPRGMPTLSYARIP